VYNSNYFAINLMPSYSKSEKTARKAKKQALMDAAAVQTAVQEQELADKHLALQARIDALTAEQVEVTKRARSIKNCAQRRARRQQGSPAGDEARVIVVHGSASCEEEDQDVLDLHSFLEPGINDKIDEAFEDQQAAQRAMEELVQATAVKAGQPLAPSPVLSALELHAKLRSEAQLRLDLLNEPPFFLPELPALASASELTEVDEAAAAATQQAALLQEIRKQLKRGTSRMLCEDSSDEEVAFESSSAASASSKLSWRARDAEGNLIDILERREEEEEKQEEKKTNAALHDERVVRIVEAGYLLREAISALAATKEEGLESTQRACDYLQVVH
jgi:hypothetical protein